YQVFKGFGSFAGRSSQMMKHANRDGIINALYGDGGLQLKVVRCTIPPDFNGTVTEEMEAENWIQQEAKNKYGVSTFIASAWSPPYKWKTIVGQAAGKGMNSLAVKHYPDYADYISNYIDYQEKVGLPLYAISPQNEPEFPTTDWDGCIWWPKDTATFVRYYLKPMFRDRGIKTKIIIGETANWNFANMYLALASLYLPDEDFDIYGSHGYSLPMFPEFKYVIYGQQVMQWRGVASNKERWITEASSTDSFDASMNKGIQLAVSISRLLHTGNINGYIFWSSLQYPSNEALIIDNRQGGFFFPRVYYVYGQFSRYIKPGHIRIGASKSLFAINSNIEVVAFKDPLLNTFSVVITNNSKGRNEICALSFSGVQLDENSITAFVTNDQYQWSPMKLSLQENGAIRIKIPPLSVVTIIGKIRV
ncbi:glycosyl hydrolase-like protein, partial [Leptotrombidium deliense]